MSHSIDSTRRYVESLLAALKDCGHSAENVRSVLCELAWPAAERRMQEPLGDGGPAFPAPELGQQDFGQPGAYPGMSLRDYFAAKAMHAVLSMPDEFRVPGAGGVAQLAYQMADAMVAARTPS